VPIMTKAAIQSLTSGYSVADPYPVLAVSLAGDDDDDGRFQYLIVLNTGRCGGLPFSKKVTSLDMS
jgi:hypothetical protein